MWIISTQFGDNEWHPKPHRAADEVDVTAQIVELGNDDRILSRPPTSFSAVPLGPEVQRCDKDVQREN
jgi:hypothetical protein